MALGFTYQMLGGEVLGSKSERVFPDVKDVLVGVRDAEENVICRDACDANS
jgi:hypothetical protein